MATEPPPKIHIIGVPTEAGTHFAGQSKAPRALIHDAKLATCLEKAGYDVEIQENMFAPTTADDLDISSTALWKPSPKTNGIRNADAAQQVMKAVRDCLMSSYTQRRDSFPLIIGGDCSMAPAILSAYARVSPLNIGIVYFDGDADLTLPSQTSAEGSSGILDSMVLSMLTQREGVLDWMKDFASWDGSALVTSENIVLFGFDPLQPSPEHWTYLLEHRFRAFTRPSVQADPVACARKALEYLKERVDVIMLHFDVDAVDSGEFPLANYPHYAGLGVEQAMAALGVFLEDEKVVCAVVTEVNPNNDADGRMCTRLVEGLVEGLTKRKDRLGGMVE